jgi:PrcB C-terminal
MQRDTLIIGAVCVLAIAVGAWLFISEGEQVMRGAGNGEVMFTTIQHGTQAVGISERTNYRVKTQEELVQLWERTYHQDAPDMPMVNFDTHHILAVFDGTRSSGGYDIRVGKIVDDGQDRYVTIIHTVPGESCMVTDAITSPFEFVLVPKSMARIVREDVEEVRECN